MKITLIEEPGADKELIIRCESVDAEIEELLHRLSPHSRRFMIRDANHTRFLDPKRVLYCEYVDGRVFAYTADEVLPVVASLTEIETDFAPFGFIRCSKSMVVNINRIDALTSYTGGRIIATIANGERIVISRHYAKALRDRLCP